jgi:hypothetical protein
MKKRSGHQKTVSGFAGDLLGPGAGIEHAV